MEKLKMHSPDLTQENIANIRELFPDCVTEARGDDGQVKLAVDFDQLRQTLTGSIVEGPQERYHLNWPGKREALLTANAPIAKTLRPARDESVDFDTTKNLFIEGDNLDALKLLQETYLGKVKMIYIDPPYNTGNDFIYADDFAEDTSEYLARSNQKDEAGNRLIANTDANGRFHSDWLSMMYPRLKLARNTLAEDGIIIISIGDDEISNLRKMCDDIFGSENFIATFIWKRRQNVDSRSKNGASTDHEYAVIYSKHATGKIRGGEKDLNKYSNPDNDPRGDWMSADMTGLATKDQRPNLHYDVVDPRTGINYGCPVTGWRYEPKRMKMLIANDEVIFPKEPSGRPRRKKFLADLTSQYTGKSTVLKTVYNTQATRELRELFEGIDYFDFPKPIDLIKEYISQIPSPDEAIVMDFFAGSGTTAHATLQLNAEDGRNRKYILVQLPEVINLDSEAHQAGYTSIADIGKDRIRRAGKKILDGEVHEDWNKDIGFRVLKVDSSNMSDVYYKPDEVGQDQVEAFIDNIKEGRTAEDLLFQVLLDWGVDLTLPIEKKSINGHTVFVVDTNALVACFDKDVNEELVRRLADTKPLRVVFRDTGFVSDDVKINVEQIFKQLSPGTDVKAI